MIRAIAAGALLAALAGCGGREAVPTPAPSSYTEQLPGTALSFDLVYLAGGRFRMGSADGDADERPMREVQVAPFWIGRTEVTWDEYQLFCDEYENPPEGVDAVTRPSPPGHGVPARGLGQGRQPAMGVSWNAAQRYCEWISKKTGRAYRLPTEAEWEFACRAGSDARYPFGDAETGLDEHAWFAENSGGMTRDVGLKKPNAFGLCDMLGNVWEYAAEPYRRDGTTAVLRGGSYADGPAALRSANRQEFLFKWIERDPQRPRSRWWAFDGPVGFRLARSLD